MNIVLLAAGTSSRMGRVNKMLLPIDDIPMVSHCAINALKALSDSGEKSCLIVVTGYRAMSLNKALKPCRKFIEETSKPLKMIVVKNTDYRKGQFSSVKTGVKEVPEGENFFICLADLPQINKDNYLCLLDCLEGYDAVRPFSEDIPGHPVYCSSKIKQLVLAEDCDSSVSKILKRVKTRNLQVEGSSWIKDIDTPSDFNCRQPDKV